MSDYNISNVKRELERNSKLSVSKSGDVLSVRSDYWGEVPASGRKPTEVQVSVNDYGFMVNAVDVDYRREELDEKYAVIAVESLLKDNNLY